MPSSYVKQNCLWTLSNVPWGQNQPPALPSPLPLPHLLVNHWPSPLTWACLIHTCNPTAVISVHPWEMLQRKWALCSQQSPDCLTIRHMRNGLPWWLRGKEPTWQCKRHGFDPWVGKILWKRKWKPTPIFFPEKSLGQRSLAGYSPYGHKESDMT